MEKKKFNNALFIRNKRKELLVNDNLEFQNKRQKFLDWLIVKQDVKVLEMYLNGKESIYSKKITPQYFKEWKFCNTRTQIKTEITLEPKDNLGFEKAVSLLCDLGCELVKNKIHFAVFYATGQRSPYIKIYDFDQLEQMNQFQRMKARLKWLRWIVPFRQHLFDTALLDDSHFVPLEFAPHWKYGTIFNLIFEYLPEEEENKNAIST